MDRFNIIWDTDEEKNYELEDKSVESRLKHRDPQERKITGRVKDGKIKWFPTNPKHDFFF